jgi:hypothetical protein
MHELLLYKMTKKRLLLVPADDEDEIGGGGSSSPKSILPNDDLSKQWGSWLLPRWLAESINIRLMNTYKGTG